MKQSEFLLNLLPSLHDVFARIFYSLNKYDLTDYLSLSELWYLDNWSVVFHRWNNLVFLIGIFERILKDCPFVIEWLVRDVDKDTFNAMMSFVTLYEFTKKHLITNL